MRTLVPRTLLFVILLQNCRAAGGLALARDPARSLNSDVDHKSCARQPVAAVEARFFEIVSRGVCHARTSYAPASARPMFVRFHRACNQRNKRNERNKRNKRDVPRHRTCNSSMTRTNKPRVRSLSLGDHKTLARLIASKLPLRRVSLETRIPGEPRDPFAFSACRKSALPLQRLDEEQDIGLSFSLSSLLSLSSSSPWPTLARTDSRGISLRGTSATERIH